MDQRDQFSKWMQAIEEALSDEKKEIAESMPEAGNQCGCGSWDCPVCFPEQDEAPGGVTPVVVAAAGCPACGQGAPVCPACGQPHGGNQDGQLSPMSVPPQGEMETEVPMEPVVDPLKYQMGMTGMEEEEPFFDGELEETEPDASEPEMPPVPAAPVDRTPSNGKPGVKLGHITQKFEPLGGADPEGEDSPLTYGEDNLDEDDYSDNAGPTDDELAGIENSSDPFVNPQAANQDVESIMYMQDMGLSMSDTHYDERELYTLTPEQLQAVKAEVLGGQEPPMEEDDMMQDMGAQAQTATGGTLGGAAAQAGGGSGGYAPGTAPTMPESIQRNTMENIDSDIARVMKGFSQYDALKASKAIVSEKKKIDELSQDTVQSYKDKADPWNRAKNGDGADAESRFKKGQAQADKRLAEDGEGNPWAKGGSKSEEADDKKEKTTHKGGTVTKTDSGIKHKGTYGGEKKDVKESTGEVDPEVLEWMHRFSKLGNMKGYGR